MSSIRKLPSVYLITGAVVLEHKSGDFPTWLSTMYHLESKLRSCFFFTPVSRFKSNRWIEGAHTVECPFVYVFSCAKTVKR